MRTLVGLIGSMRPKQWIKNLLVFAAPAAAGVLDEPDQLARTSVTFLAFGLVAGAMYIVNDLIDRERDAHHPTKRNRPIPSGRVSVTAAVVAAMVALGLGGAIVLVWVNLPVLFLLMGYVANTLVYSVVGKHEPVIDVVQVSIGFVLRAVGGALAVDVPISEWFAIVVMFGALLMVVGKRASEVKALEGSADSRPILDRYSPLFLHHLHAVSTTGMLLAYSLWAFETAEQATSAFPWFELSIVPIVVAILRYGYAIDAGSAQAPEDALFADRVLLAAAAVWAGLFFGGMYG